MSAELYASSESNASLQGTTVGGSKPLHRFIKGQPKIIGIIILVLGTSFFTLSVAIMQDYGNHMGSIVPPGIIMGFLVGSIFIICGILYIVTEHNTTKKTVTISLALSIVTLLVTCWTILHIAPVLVHSHYYRHYSLPEFLDENETETISWSSHYEEMGTSIEAINLLHSLVGAIIFIVMSILAGAALRSTKSQAIVVMATTAETPVE